MRRIYTIIVLFGLIFSPNYAQSGPTNGLKKISLTGSGTKNGHTLAISNTATKSAAVNTTSLSSLVSNGDTITAIGFLKDRHCVAMNGSLTLPLTGSCGIGCGTTGMAYCWGSGLGVYLYNPTATGTLTQDSARSATHFILFDEEGKELTRAFLESLPSAASGKITIKVKGYWTANGIASSKNEKTVPELTADSVDHYLKSFHLYSIEGIYIKDGISKSYSYFDTVSYKITTANLAPTKIQATNYTGGTTLKFNPPANIKSAKSTLKGYKARVYSQSGVVQDTYTTLVNDSSVTSINIAGLTASQNYSYTVSALYPGSAVEAESKLTSGTETQIGWFKDRDCLYDSLSLPLKSSCWIDCGTGSGSMASCWNSGLGIFIYDASQTGKISVDSSRTDTHYLLFDAQSKELTRAFLETLPTAANTKILVKVTGYRVANGISSDKSELYVPATSTDSIDHYLNAFHLLSIEGVVVDTLGYSGFATKSYKLTPADLTPSNLSVSYYTGGARVKFTPPANEGNGNSTLTGYKVRVYSKAGVIQNTYTTIVNDTTVTSINVSGFTASPDYTFTVSALYPGSNVEAESEPLSGIETQVGFFHDRDCVAMMGSYDYSTDNSSCSAACGLMSGCWKSGLGVFIYDGTTTGTLTQDEAKSDAHFLLFDAQSKELARAFVEKIKAVIPTADSYKLTLKVSGYRVINGISANTDETLVPDPANNHYLNAFHLLSIEGIYVETLANSYSGFATNSYKLTPANLAPTNLSAVNYAGGSTINFAPPENASNANTTLSGFKVRVYDSAGVLQDSYTTTVNDKTVTSIAVTGFTASQDYTFTVSSVYASVAKFGTGIEVESEHSNVVGSTTSLNNTTTSRISVYPTLSQGKITIISPEKATIKVLDYTGKTIETYQSSGSRTINLNVSSGLYLVYVESAGETSIQKVIIRK